jgi:hypothetical protein
MINNPGTTQRNNLANRQTLKEQSEDRKKRETR